MELALPHVVVRVCGPGAGVDLVAALTVHPIEVTETRDRLEMHRVSGGRPAILVVVVDPPDARAAVSETWADFPGVPILVVSDQPHPYVPSETGRTGWVDTVPSDQPIQDICWLVLEAVSRAAHRPGITERPLGPHRIEIDGRGNVLSVSLTPDVAIATLCRMRAGDSLVPLVEPLERDVITAAIERAEAGATQFMTTRLLDDSGGRHIVSLGLRRGGDGRIAVLIQPIVCGGTIVGRGVYARDRVRGLRTRWAVSRALDAGGREGPSLAEPAVILLTLADFDAIGHYLEHRQIDVVLLGVAAALNHVFPYPSLTSRLMGDTFLAYMPQAEPAETRHRAEQLLEALAAIEVPGFLPRFGLRGAIGVARVTDGDHDLALRLAEAAAAEAHAAGGQRFVVAGDPQFSPAQTRMLTTSMDLGSWEMWLQPVVRHGHEQAEYHEALARFDGQKAWASRADLFLAGQAQGLLERFDRMMLQRALEMLESHADARLSVNISFETFTSKAFPGSVLELIRRVHNGCGRIILEIAPRCLAAPEELVRPRLESLAEAGVAVALDDFGSGLCRLRHLTQLPLSIVKLDQLVTGYVDDDPLQRDFVRTVVSLCRARGITTVAEYTRSAEQLARLVADGVDLFQGEFFGMPRPAAAGTATSPPDSDRRSPSLACR
ncbi:MAG: EAL domain-containing protein [Planctomycetia bacterium]